MPPSSAVEPLADVAHEAELVQLAAQREQHREPEEGDQRAALQRRCRRA